MAGRGGQEERRGGVESPFRQPSVPLPLLPSALLPWALINESAAREEERLAERGDEGRGVSLPGSHLGAQIGEHVDGSARLTLIPLQSFEGGKLGGVEVEFLKAHTYTHTTRGVRPNEQVAGRTLTEGGLGEVSQRESRRREKKPDEEGKSEACFALSLHVNVLSAGINCSEREGESECARETRTTMKFFLSVKHMIGLVQRMTALNG